MGTTHYRFGRFRLNPQARELFDGDDRVTLPVSTIDSLVYLIAHRDRPVGRDELAAAVWGRVDVSEVSLSHAIMRLRRLLGDTGNEQRTIRTVPRLGYRWVMEGTTEETESPAPRETTIAQPEAPVALREPASSNVSSSGRRAAMFALATVAVIAAVLFVFLRDRTDAHVASSATPMPAMVLPVVLDAPSDAIWLRLGLMDLVASRLRRGGIATAPSETVVALSNAHDGRPLDRGAFPDSLIVQPSATFSRGGWNVRLETHDARRELSVEATADDPIAAGRKATDELLIKLGRVPADADDRDVSVAQATLRQRVNAAVLSGQIDVARDLIRNAGPALQMTPEIALSEAKVEFFGGHYAKSRETIEALLARLPANTPAHLRARALNTLGAAYFREGRIDEAGKAYAESIRLAEHADRPDVLAVALIGSGGVSTQRLRFDEAAGDYGRARTLFDLGNDAFGVAAVDLNLGMIALQRGQPAAALPTLRGAAQRFEKLAAEDALAATLVAIVDADLALLDIGDALATSERFTALQSRGGNGRERWELLLARARALAGAGKLADADTLLARIADGSEATEDAMLRAQANGRGAEVALARGECAHAADLAAAGMAPALEAAVPADYARIARHRVQALQCSGQTAAAVASLAAFDDWAATAPPAAVGIERLLAHAEQAAATGSHEDAVKAYAAVLVAAAEGAIPDEIVAAGLGYVRALVAAGRVDEAVSVNGRTAAWADRDARAALAQALVYAALKKDAAADEAFDRARRLAGERTLAGLPAAHERTAGP